MAGSLPVESSLLTPGRWSIVRHYVERQPYGWRLLDSKLDSSTWIEHPIDARRTAERIELADA